MGGARKPKPILGYPSRGAAALALRAQGMKAAEIAARMGGQAASVMREDAEGRSTCLTHCSLDALRQMSDAGWITPRRGGRVSTWEITDAGRAVLAAAARTMSVSVEFRCPACGGGNVHLDRLTLTRGRMEARGIRCLDCGHTQDEADLPHYGSNGVPVPGAPR